MRTTYFIKPVLRWATGVAFLAAGLGTSWGVLLADDAFIRPIVNGNALQPEYDAAEYRLTSAYNGLLAQNDQPAAPPAPASGDSAAAAAAPAADNGAEAEKKDEPWTLVSLFDDECGQNCLKDKGLTIAGWMDWGWQSKADGSFCGNGPFLDDHEWKSFNLNQMYLYAEKIADGSKGFGWGYRADLFYGVDGNEGQSFGNNPGRWDFANGWDHGIYEWAMPQLYAELAYDKFSVKLGHFYTMHGYEVVQPTGNFFLSRQITFYNSEPFTHTGALGTYKANDKLSVQAGWVLGWDTGFDQLAGGNMGMTGLTYAFSDNTTFIYTLGFGNFGWRGTGVIDSLILTQKWAEKFSTVHQFDALQTNTGTDFATSGIPGDSIGFINYAFYELTDKVKAGARLEWFKADGVSYNTLTYGVNYKPQANLTIRPEVRHLWAPGAQGGPSGSIANNVSDVYGNSTVFGVDAIVTF